MLLEPEEKSCSYVKKDAVSDVDVVMVATCSSLWTEPPS